MSVFRITIPRMIILAVLALGLVACSEHEEASPPVRPVRTVTIEQGTTGEPLTLTGQIRAQTQTNLAFRVDGRVIERHADVGDRVEAGQLIARLDPQIQKNGLRQAEADLSAARAQLVQARNDFERQKSLVESGYASRTRFDAAEQTLKTAKAQVDSAEAQVRNATEQLDFTELYADSDGSVTAIGAEPGEVAAAGQMVVQVAHEGGLDAVFDVPAQTFRRASKDVVIQVALADDPAIKVMGRVREVAPQADSATRTFPVKVGLIDPPEAMRLGMTVTGSITLNAPEGIELPASALMQAGDHPAVWVVDPETKTVSLRNIDVIRYDAATVVVGQGLTVGEIVVTAGVQTLRPDQMVRLLGDDQ
jgi:RND family efflux transporter MFP subunit